MCGIRSLSFVTKLSVVGVHIGHGDELPLVQEVFPPTLEGPVRGGLYKGGTILRSLEFMDPKRFVLSVDDDTEFRSRCE